MSTDADHVCLSKFRNQIFFSLFVHLRLIEFRLHTPVVQVTCSLQTRGSEENKIYNFCPGGKWRGGRCVWGGGREGGTLWSDLEGERVKKYSAIES